MTNLYKPIPMFSNYAISDNGVVYRISDGKFLNYGIRSGYKYYGKMVDEFGTKRTMAAHRLVAMTYHGIPDNMNELAVNHINGNPSDNRACNLEWCTRRENSLHAGLYGLTPKWIPIQVRNMHSGRVLEFDSFLACANYFGLSKDAIAWRVNSGEHRVDDLFNQYRYATFRETWREPTEFDCGVLLRNVTKNEITFFWTQQEICELCGVSPAFITTYITDPTQPLFRMGDDLFQAKQNTVNNVWVDYPNPYWTFEQTTMYRFVVMYNPAIEEPRIFFTCTEAAAAYGVKKNVPFWRAQHPRFEPWHDGLICHYLFN